MTYNEIIDIFKKKVQGHFFINEFGYGDISDIMTPNDGKAPYYPYIFLNPVTVTSNDRTSSFNFNLICMTQCRDDEYQIIKKQSDCIDNLRDIIAQVNNTLIDPLVEIQPNYTFTPFKERFQDDVVGASCNITVTYPSQLNACNVPISEPTYCLIADSFSKTNANEFNTTYTFGGWGYFKYKEDTYDNQIDKYFEFVCDTRYAYYISTDPVTDGDGDTVYPIMAYVDTGYPDSTITFLKAYYIFYQNDGTSFECGSTSSVLYDNLTNNAVSYVNTTSDNGWVIPTEGWVKTFDYNDSQDRTGNVYIFETDCTNPKPSPTAAPVPPPSNTPTPTPTVTSTVTPTPTASIVPSLTPTSTVTPTLTVTPTPSVTPANPPDCLYFQAVTGGTGWPDFAQSQLYYKETNKYVSGNNGTGDVYFSCVTDNYISYVSEDKKYAFFAKLNTDNIPLGPPYPAIWTYGLYNITNGLSCNLIESSAAPEVEDNFYLSGFEDVAIIVNDYYYPKEHSYTGTGRWFTITYNPTCPTPTPTPSVTSTNTPTPTTTPTVSVTPTSTVTSTPTVTPTITISPTISITPTISVTPTNTTTPTPSITSTVTPTISVTPSVTNTVTPTTSITPSVTATVTPSVTPSSVVAETYHIEAQNADIIIAQNGDNIDWFPM